MKAHVALGSSAALMVEQLHEWVVCWRLLCDPLPSPFFPGYDVIAQAQSGTGKTATFAISILQQIELDLKATQALVLAPTRELAQQVSDNSSWHAGKGKTHVPGWGASVREWLFLRTKGGNGEQHTEY